MSEILLCKYCRLLGDIDLEQPHTGWKNCSSQVYRVDWSFSCFSSARYGTRLSALFKHTVALPCFKGTRAPNCIPPRLIHLCMSIYKPNTHRPVVFDSGARTHSRPCIAEKFWASRIDFIYRMKHRTGVLAAAGGHRRERHWGVCQAARGYHTSFKKEVYFRKKGETVEFGEARATYDVWKRARRWV